MRHRNVVNLDLANLSLLVASGGFWGGAQGAMPKPNHIYPDALTVSTNKDVVKPVGDNS